MNWVMGIDPAVPDSEATAAWGVKVIPDACRPKQITTVAYPAPFDFRLLGFHRTIDVPDGCLRVCGESEL